MKKKVRGLFLVFMIGMAGIMTACGSEEASSSEDKKEKLVVGTDAAFAPFEYMDKGEIVGFDIDFLEAVMKEAGYEYEVKNIGWDPLFAAVQGGKEVDMGISGITINDDRKETFDFSNPYFESTHMIMFGEGVDIKSADDLKGLKIGVQNGTTGQAAAEKIVGQNSPDISKYENNVVAITALKQGQVDAVVTDNTVVNEYVKNNPDDNFNTVEDPENFESEFYGLMFPKDSELKADFDKAVKEVIENGTYAEIYKEWFGTEPNTDALLEQAE
ncbi:MAG: basic amino acid ABC transporter substrate-binding protein [Bacillota bacterium]|uniref:basic amino acid ABC transporter substrate-binding protein n=1 Tax=Rossellomorea TaxID=2837508 RepID=UPI0005CAEE48|nr:basic amino acid ABC transporter substrate-binding protein [Rossellomorea aquimaris]